MSIVDPQPPSADLLVDLLGPLAIEGPPSSDVQSQPNIVPGFEDAPNAVEATAIVPVGEQANSVQVLLTVIMKNLYYLAERIHIQTALWCK